MAERVERFNVNVPAETSLLVEALTFSPGTVTGFTIEIPHGHHRLTGIAIYYGDGQVIPHKGSAYFRGDHTQRHWDLDDPFPGGTGWYAQAFNNDHHYDHTFHCEVELDEVSATAVQLPPVILLPFAGEAVAATATPTVTIGGSGVLVE
jgi:hypothetical protein